MTLPAILSICSLSIQAGQTLEFPAIIPTIRAEASYHANPLITLAVSGELYQNDESNVAAMLKTSLVPLTGHQAYICAGFGWGHKFTTERTDHNYHTYNIGMEFQLFQVTDHLSVTSTAMSEWRTYAEHIGFDSDRFRLSINLGITYKF